MIAVVTGLIGSYPMGGMTFHYIQYLLGLRQLGWKVLYLEDTGKWFYDPVKETFVDEPGYNIAYLVSQMDQFGLGDSWCLRDAGDRWHGPAAEEMPEVLRNVDLFLNISGSCWLRPEYRACRNIVYVDTDPGYTQFKVAEAAAGNKDEDLRYSVDRMAEHDFHATFGENIGSEECSVPVEIFEWIPTRQPIVLDLWEVTPHEGPLTFSTVLSWNPYLEPFRFGDELYYGKLKEFERIKSLPLSCEGRFELAVTGGAPEEDLRDNGWEIRDALSASSSPSDYQLYIRASAAEFSVAKDIYVGPRTGWFSERTACYLASGRPAVVQETGFSKILPTGAGLHPFSDLDEAKDAVEKVTSNYAAESAGARATVEQSFESKRVLSDLLTAVKL